MNHEFFLECFQSYAKLSEMLKVYSYEEISERIASVYNLTVQQLEMYGSGEFLNTSLCVKHCTILKELIDNCSRYDWIYEKLADQISKDLFFDLVCFRILPDRSYLEERQYDKKSCPLPDIGSVTWLKIDETKSFSSADVIMKEKEQIKTENPAICMKINSVWTDLWEIPQLIDYMHSDYRFYLRKEKQESGIVIVFYALPQTAVQTNCRYTDVLPRKAVKAAERHTEIKKVVAMAPYDTPWRNVELIKDCGLIPYLLYKRHGCEVSMVGAKGEGYSYHSLIDGVQLEFLQNGSYRAKLHYVAYNAKQIDLLILRGPYPDNLYLGSAYKKANPNGKIYVGLDANATWMDKINYEHPIFQEFMDNCDVIATSGAATARYLNEKWPWKIEHIPNGYYDFEQRNLPPNFSVKGNVILTISRLGTKQKATHVLLEAFAKAAESLPDWKLRLVGSVDSGFHEYIAEYNIKYPQLLNRIEWVGSISDRTQLFQEYQKAKIFALTSTIEGGTPNVIAEALNGGCVIATTRIDDCEEATNSNICGRIANIDDVRGFADILLELAQSDKLEEMSEAAYQYRKQHFDMEQIVDKLYELISGE